MKIRIILTLIALVLLAGCTKPSDTGNAPAGSEQKTTFKAGMVTDLGGVNDKSFNASAWKGLERASKEFGFEPKFIESKSASDYAPNLESLAQQGYTIVFAVGYRMADALAQVAPKYPNTKFAIIDNNAPEDANKKPLPNTAGLLFREQDGSFLVGYLAGAMSKSGKVGFVGGKPGSLIKKFETGYSAGVKTANPNATVFISYTDSWDDTPKGKSQTLTHFGQGADIVYHAAGRTGLGVIAAAGEKGEGYYAIGVDMDQDDIAPGRVLTSMIKRVDNAVYDTIKKTKDGAFVGGNVIYGLKEDGVGISALTHTKDKIPAQVLTNLDTLKAMIIEGKFTCPATDEELKAFVPPTLSAK